MSERRVTTEGESTATARPDLAEVRLRVDGRGQAAGAAYRQARDQEGAVREALSAAGVAEGRVRTTDLELEDREDGFEFGPDDPDYRAVVSLTVDCVPETVEDVAVAAADAGATIREVTFDVGEDRRTELRERALAEATADARERAEAVAAAEGLSVGPVLEATTGDADGLDGLADEAFLDETPELVPSPIEVGARVEVTYELRSDGE